jgi:hypothetical protein
MNTTTTVVGTGIVVAAGRWSQGKGVEMRTFVGVGVLAIFLAIMGEGNAKLAQQFGALVLVAAVLIYAIPISKGLQGGYSTPTSGMGKKP